MAVVPFQWTGSEVKQIPLRGGSDPAGQAGPPAGGPGTLPGQLAIPTRFRGNLHSRPTWKCNIPQTRAFYIHARARERPHVSECGTLDLTNECESMTSLFVQKVYISTVCCKRFPLKNSQCNRNSDDASVLLCLGQMEKTCTWQSSHSLPA